MRRRRSAPRVFTAIAAGVAAACVGGTAHAFPPYRSTDAGTADPYDLELRLGLARLERKAGRTNVLSPLVRANLGLPRGFELVSELEYSPRADDLADGAIGAKWASAPGPLSVGLEALALLPVSHASSGVGIEAQLLATLRRGQGRLHLNAGGFHDPRGGVDESGWRASALAEVERDGYRVGLELFGKDSDRGPTDVRAGAGVIYPVGRFDIRSGVHLGLTRGAPDVVVSLWVATKFPLRD